ncbi:FG-GAP repeat domain-containing protein [Bacteroidota bacterium]
MMSFTVTTRTQIIAIAVMLPFLAACSSGSVLKEKTPQSGREYHRLVAPFSFRDSLGVEYDQPFLGGLNIPRPQFVDIDADGDPDLFLQEVAGRVAFLENMGNASVAEFIWQTDAYHALDIGDWYRFVDIDDDGDFDLLTEREYGLIRYFRNDGTPEIARYTLAEDSLRDVTQHPIFSDRQNNPNVADIDCDGLLDLFIGRLDGTVTRYELDHLDEHAIPRFRLITERFENIEIIAQFGSLHGANGLSFFDVDDDGDLDFFWGDFFEAGLLFIENTGTCAVPNLRDKPTNFPIEMPIATSGYNIPVFADIDGNGTQDLFVAVIGGAFDPNHTSADNFYFLPNQGNNTFVLNTKRYLYSLDVGTESLPALADLDADGDLDLFIANKIDPYEGERAHVYLATNTGDAEGPSFAISGRMQLTPSFHYAPEFADVDADGDLDLLMGTWNKGLSFYRNNGSPQMPDFDLVEEGYVTLTRGSNSTPTMADLDGDGDLDLLVGESSGTINYYQNAGSPTDLQLELVTDRFDDIDVGRRSVPVLVDLDRDGDFDLIIGSETGETFVYRNEGTPEVFHFVLDVAATIQLPVFATPELADIDADGDLDMISGGSPGGLFYYQMDQ